MQNDTTKTRADRRAAERLERDRNRRLRGLTAAIVAALAADDPTVSGATLMLPDGSIQFLDADALRRGGNA